MEKVRSAIGVGAMIGVELPVEAGDHSLKCGRFRLGGVKFQGPITEAKSQLVVRERQWIRATANYPGTYMTSATRTMA